MVHLSTIAKYGLGSVIGTMVLGDITEQSMRKFDTDIQKPIDTVSIIIPSYNEGRTVELATASIREQSIIQEYPEYFETILVDSSSTDDTVTLAKPYVDRVLIVPRGKLTARNIATNEAKGNIIVSTDSDSYYPYHWLNTLLKPFNDLNNQPIAGVIGNTLDYGIANIPGWLHSAVYTLDRIILHPRQMPGRNSAYYKHLFYISGGFDEGVNQYDINSMLNEEEIGFGDRLAKFGKLVFKISATCIHLGGQKVACRFGLENKNACKGYGIGTDRF